MGKKNRRSVRSRPKDPGAINKGAQKNPNRHKQASKPKGGGGGEKRVFMPDKLRNWF